MENPAKNNYKPIGTALYPCLWFNSDAKTAAEFYCAVFQNGNIVQENPMVVTFELDGSLFMGLNGGPKYRVNPAISYYVYCGNNTRISQLYHELSANGKVLMPLGNYAWSPQYAWVEDRFGVNWQLDVDDINSAQKIVPTLLFANAKTHLVKDAIRHYTTIFNPSKTLLEAPYPPGAAVPEGSLLFAQCKLNNFILNATSSTLWHNFDFSPGNSLVLSCDTQAEIDYYWEKLGEGGREDRCGWLADKFGVSWQIIPAILTKLIADPKKGHRVVQAFLHMKKFDIATLMNV